MNGKEGVLPSHADYDNVRLADGKIHTWKDMESDDAGFTVALRKEYLNHFGLGQLTAYLDSNTRRFPNLANGVFWGDKWDGISQIPALTRAALYGLLVVRNQALNPAAKGKFFDMTAAVSSAPAKAGPPIQRFSYLSAELAPNPFSTGRANLTVGGEWRAWGTTLDPKFTGPGGAP